MFFFDIFLSLGIIYSFYYGYRHGVNKKLYELTKVFVGFSVAGSLSFDFALFLTKLKILAPDNPHIMKLIGFIFIFLIYWGVIYLYEKHKDKLFRKGSKKANKILGGVTNSLQIFLAVTVTIFLITQFTYGKRYVKPYLNESFLYPKIDRVYKRLLTKSFVNSIIKGNMTGTNSKDLFLQTITDDNLLRSVQ